MSGFCVLRIKLCRCRYSHQHGKHPEPSRQWNAAPEMVVAIHNANPERTPPKFILVESRATQKRKEKRETRQEIL